MSYCNVAIMPRVAGRWFAPGTAKKKKTRQKKVQPQGFHVLTGVSNKPQFFFLKEEGEMTVIEYRTNIHPWDDLLTIDADNPFNAQVDVTLRLDNAFHNGEFDDVATALDSFSVDEASTDLLISILSSTIPARPKLKQHRDDFFVRVQRSLDKRGDLEPGLLDGLE